MMLREKRRFGHIAESDVLNTGLCNFALFNGAGSGQYYLYLSVSAAEKHQYRIERLGGSPACDYLS
jgi:hypothetical protein